MELSYEHTEHQAARQASAAEFGNGTGADFEALPWTCIGDAATAADTWRAACLYPVYTFLYLVFCKFLLVPCLHRT